MIVDRTTDLSKHGSCISNDEDEISTPSGSHILFWAKINNIRDNTESKLRQDGIRTELVLMHRLIIMKPDRGLNMHVNQYRTQVQSWQNHGYIYNINEAKTYTLKAKKSFMLVNTLIQTIHMYCDHIEPHEDVGTQGKSRQELCKWNQTVEANVIQIMIKSCLKVLTKK